MTPESLEAYQQAQSEVRSALGAPAGRGRELSRPEGQSELPGASGPARGHREPHRRGARDFNEAAQRYNVAVRRFPANLVAGLFGFDRKPYFEAAEGAEAAPSVAF